MSTPPAETPLPLVDAHHHLWDLGVYHYPWLANPNTPITKRYLVDDLLADGRDRNLVKSVHVQAEIDRNLSVAETAWLQALADEHGFPHAVVAYAPLQDPGAGALLEAHAQHRNMRGIRQILNPDQCERSDFLTDAAWQAGYARLARYGLSFDLQAMPSQMADAASVARAYPDVPMIVNHTGMPRDRSAEGMAAWRAGLKLLAEHPHVSLKISGFAMFDPDWTVESIRPYVLESLELFGAQRCMLGSNFPVDKLHRSFDTIFEAFRTLTAGLSDAEQRAIFHDNAQRIYRLS
jgi:predicted TIM-barrel fold metal-dependent hydrolase